MAEAKHHRDDIVDGKEVATPEIGPGNWKGAPGAGQPADARSDAAVAPNQVNIQSILRFTAIITIACVVISVAMLGMYNALASHQRSRDTVIPPIARQLRRESPDLPPAPRLEGIEMRRTSEANRGIVEPKPYDAVRRMPVPVQPDGYGWVDQSKGIARIPVRRAMELVVTELNNDAPVQKTGGGRP